MAQMNLDPPEEFLKTLTVAVAVCKSKFNEVSNEHLSEKDAMKIVGCSVKSAEREDGIGWPKYHGILIQLEDGNAAVVSYPADKVFVWLGTEDEYFEMWRCD